MKTVYFFDGKKWNEALLDEKTQEVKIGGIFHALDRDGLLAGKYRLFDFVPSNAVGTIMK